MKAIFKNRTGIEDWVLEKAAFRREGTSEEFLHPYDLGWKTNALQVINWSLTPKGDGINWQIREGCHQYTFTVGLNMNSFFSFSSTHYFLKQIEQIKQKEFKRERSLEYSVVRDYSGKW